MIDPTQPPNPANSPNEKLLVQRQQLWTPNAMSQYLEEEGLDTDTAAKIGRAFARLEQESQHEYKQLLDELQRWSNVHTHPGTGTPGGVTEGTEYGTRFIALSDTGGGNSSTVFTLDVGETSWLEWPSAIGGRVTTLASRKDRIVGIDGAAPRYGDDPFTAWANGTSINFFLANYVAWNGTKFVAVGDGGKISESTDGITWTDGTALAGTANLLGVGWDGVHWYTCNTNGAIYRALNSETNLSWSSVASSLGSVIKGIAYNGLKYLAWGTASGELKTYYTTDDGLTWTNTGPYPAGTKVGGVGGFTAPGSKGFVLSPAGTTAAATDEGPIFIEDPATGSHALCLKADGVTRLANTPVAFGNAIWDGVRWRMLGPMDDGSTGAWQMWTSDDGIVWTPHSSFVSSSPHRLLAYNSPLHPVS